MLRRSSTGSIFRTSVPSIRIRPPDGSMSRLIMRSVVVLPQPEGPTRTQSSPSGIVKLSSATATESAPYRLVTRSSVITARKVSPRRARVSSERCCWRPNPFFRWSYVTSDWSQIQGDLVQHIELSLIAVAIGTAISIPLAVLAWRYRIIRTPVFGFASALYIIPSLALFAILGPITGFVASYTTGRDRAGGLHAAHPHLEHGRRPRCRPRRRPGGGDRAGVLEDGGAGPGRPPPRPAVHLRRARVATATVIGLVTVTALIGLGGLGQQITYGFNIDLQHPDHRRPRPLRRPGRRGRPPPGRGGATPRPVGALASPGAGGAADMPFLAHVFGWFTTSANWTGSQGIPTLFWNQLKLSVAVVVTAIALGGGLGVILGHTGRGGLVAVNAANAFRAVPTLALLTLLAIQPAISLKWSGFLASWLALTALAIPPILTNTYVGMREVDADVRDAAKAMGLTGGQVLRTVEAPLAVPFVMAGVRTASIEVVATSTLAAYVSYADLGTLVISGLDTNDAVVAFSGALLVAAMAGLVTLALSLADQGAHTPAAAPAAAPEPARRRR